MMKFLLVSIIWRSPVKPVDQLRPIFDLADEWITYGGGNWILYTAEDTFTWSGRVRAFLTDTDSFFIFEISNIQYAGGWMPPWVWEWVHKDRSSNLISLPLPPHF